MQQYEVVYEALNKLNISYDVVEHPPALTTEEADHYIEGKEGVRTKTLFLCNKKSTAFYLVIMDDAKRLDMKRLEGILEEKGLRFCSAEKLMDKLGVLPGAVSLFGLLNNNDKDICVCLDKEPLSERFVSFHPNENTKTLFIATADMCRFITAIGYEYKIVEL